MKIMFKIIDKSLDCLIQGLKYVLDLEEMIFEYIENKFNNIFLG